MMVFHAVYFFSEDPLKIKYLHNIFYLIKKYLGMDTELTDLVH